MCVGRKALAHERRRVAAAAAAAAPVKGADPHLPIGDKAWGAGGGPTRDKAAVDVEHLTHVMPTMPVYPEYTWDQWQEIMANQEVKEDPLAEYPGTEPQPGESPDVTFQ
ncbi:Protein of unknown function, partial [Gryllus bimaculatus]